jgi:hypothetical protein
MMDPTKVKKQSLFSRYKMEVFKVRFCICLFFPPRFNVNGVLQEFVIPTRITSIDFLKSRVVLGCSRGFEMVHLQLVGAFQTIHSSQ